MIFKVRRGKELGPLPPPPPKSTIYGMLLVDAWLTSQNWSSTDQNISTDDLASQACDTFFPMKVGKLHFSDKPRMTASLKKLIQLHQRAFHDGNPDLWHHYRDKVKREIIKQKKAFYSNNVQHLNNTNCRHSWKPVNKMSGRVNNSTTANIEKNGKILTDVELAKALNMFFVSVNADIPALDINRLPVYLPVTEEVPTIEPNHVCSKLLKLNAHKAVGPDGIPTRILKDLAIELSEPITDIFNRSLSAGTIPSIWKCADIVSIPKENTPKEEYDFRPISLISYLSKVLE